MVRYMGMLTMASATQLRQQMDDNPLSGSSTSKEKNGQDGQSKLRKIFNRVNLVQRNRNKKEMARRVEDMISKFANEARDTSKKQCNAGASSLNGGFIEDFLTQIKQKVKKIKNGMYNGRFTFVDDAPKIIKPYEYAIENLTTEEWTGYKTADSCRDLCERSNEGDKACVGWMFSEKEKIGGCRLFDQYSIKPIIEAIDQANYSENSRSYRTTPNIQATHIYALCTKTKFNVILSKEDDWVKLFGDITKQMMLVTKNVSYGDCKKQCEQDKQCLAWLHDFTSWLEPGKFPEHGERTVNKEGTLCRHLNNTDYTWVFLKNGMANYDKETERLRMNRADDPLETPVLLV